MKLTEAKLIELINEVLSEAALTPAELPEGAHVTIEQVSEDEISIDYTDSNGKAFKYNTKGVPYGIVVMDTQVQMGDRLPCLNAMMIGFSDATSGWGPMLYDIAMEIATLKGGGLVSDRTMLSPAGYAIWDYYDKNRTDVEKIQLDNEHGEITPEIEDDDCLQSTSYEWSKKKSITWQESPISKIYRKQPTTLKSLGDKLILKDINLTF